MNDSKPNSDRRVEGEEGMGGHPEGLNAAQADPSQRHAASTPEHAPNTGRSTRQGNKRSTDAGANSIADEEPGPSDDDGLPENARRRVPS